MKLVRDSNGISEKRSEISKCDTGLKTLQIENFSGGEQKGGHHIQNAVCENGAVYSLSPPVTLGTSAKKTYSPENLLYMKGPSSEAGDDIFTCSGSAEKTNTYSGGHIIKTTLTFDSTSAQSGENTDYAFFPVTLTAGTYYLHIDIGVSAAGKSAGIKFMDSEENPVSSAETTAVLHNGKYFINTEITAAASGEYNIGIAPVYGGKSTYSIDVCRLYLFDKTSAESGGCGTDVLSGLDFSGRYGSVLLPYTIKTNGEIASYIGEDGFYFSVGTDVYRRGDDGIVYLLKTNLTETNKRAFIVYGGTLYLFSESGVFSLSGGVCTAVTPKVPEYIKNCSYTGAAFTKNERINIFSQYADISFAVTENFTRTTPALICVDSVISVKSGGTTLSANEYTVSVSGGVATVTLAEVSTAEVTLRVSLSSSHSDGRISYGNYEDLRKGFCSVKTVCEAKTYADKKIMLACDKNKIYPLELKSGGYVGISDTYTEADCDITAVLPYLQWFLVFTADSVNKLTVGGESSVTLSLSVIKNDFGCDMPESAVSDGDSAVFASSSHGVFFINRYGISGSDVSRRISANVDSLLGEYTKTEKSCAVGAYSDGKYYLYIGGDFLIWDYQKKIPAYSQNSESEEKKLVWNVYSGIGTGKILGAEDSRLYLLGANGIKYFVFDGSGTSGEGSVFASETLYPAGKYAECVISEIFVSGSFSSTATLEIICDGESTPDKYTLMAAGCDTLYRIRLPLRRARGIAVKISGGAMILCGMKIRYYTTE